MLATFISLTLRFFGWTLWSYHRDERGTVVQVGPFEFVLEEVPVA